MSAIWHWQEVPLLWSRKKRAISMRRRVFYLLMVTAEHLMPMLVELSVEVVLALWP